MTTARLLATYLGVATLLAIRAMVEGRGRVLVIVVYVALLATTVAAWRSTRPRVVLLRDWLPLLALPLLYGAIPATAVTGRSFDGAVQGWDAAMFGTQPARSFAGAAPWGWLSALLHGAYFSYYLIIYVPPFLMYARGDVAAFRRTVAAFTWAMVGCFIVFCVFPVAGPRYEWAAPAGVPDGVMRRAVLSVLEAGSSRGTAFPSSHMAISLAIGLSTVEWDKRLGSIVLCLSALLGVGAVYGGFHYAVDMLAGLAVGVLAWACDRSRRAGT